MIKLEAKRFELNFLLKLSDLKSNLTLTLSYLNPALNNPALNNKERSPPFFTCDMSAENNVEQPFAVWEQAP